MNCNYCDWRCSLTRGEGRCRMYTFKDGVIQEKYPFTWSRCQAEEIEKVPIFHFLPDERILQLGSFNCNASCAYCMNASIAEPQQELATFVLQPEQVVTLAKRGQYKIIHFGINEVTVSLPSALKIAALARQNGILTGCSTNGFLTEEAAAAAAAAFDFFNLSLKSLQDSFYRQHLGLPTVAPVLRNIRYLAQHTHLEITTPITKDNEGEIPALAAWLASVNKKIPWHLFRLLPAHKLEHAAPPAVMTLVNTVTALEDKPYYIYIGNFVGSKWVNTHCRHCGETVITRLSDGACGARLQANYLKQDLCPHCGSRQDIVVEVNKCTA